MAWIEETDAGTRLSFEADRGCAQDVDASLEPPAQLDRLGSVCAPGMSRVLATGGAVSVTPTQAGEFKLTLARHACVRVGVVAQPREAALEVVVIGPGDREELMRGKSVAPMLVGGSGPVCVREAGSYTVRVRSRRGVAQVWVGAWAANAPAPISSP